ncbi:MAG: hypothetical protein EAZ39_00390 [Oscillatoriales cyanobacterium]|nr:MAG: hypothetical protein EAZ39_00390 [Oscillatoriales cyanobacterium]
MWVISNNLYAVMLRPLQKPDAPDLRAHNDQKQFPPWPQIHSFAGLGRDRQFQSSKKTHDKL